MVAAGGTTDVFKAGWVFLLWLIEMAEKFEVAERRLFDDVYICRKCNARNRTNDPGSTNCRKCGYHGLRKKNSEITE